MFKTGSVVIHIFDPLNKKMTVESYVNSLVKCMYFDEFGLRCKYFKESSLRFFEGNHRYYLKTKK